MLRESCTNYHVASLKEVTRSLEAHLLQRSIEILKVSNSTWVFLCKWGIFKTMIIVVNLPSCQDDDIFYNYPKNSTIWESVLLCVVYFHYLLFGLWTYATPSWNKVKSIPQGSTFVPSCANKIFFQIQETHVYPKS